ncbi:MAG: hypothetical protein M3352_09880 [Bacteroidota bacterium]|nr:hypothetical protein [Bacteroidota bacterium]
MYKFLFIILTLLPFDTILNAQTKKYKLIAKTENTDFNYKALKNIDNVETREARRNIFNPIKGKFIVYVFIATFIGLSFDNTEKEFHDILIVKVNKEQKITDAYQYTLEWTEPPYSYDLYRARVKGVALTNQLSIDILKFRKLKYYKKKKRELNEQGVLLF